ncbi:Xaa-Pro dipeptidyl-peptidase [Armatimonas rosea]|uniref:Xaa-Pro dipeptidyl-peptidase n=1 Tax=Armatimonas rosea TaxID=685828 RepID=A0A7W9W8Z4_ARMRO|nr:Xaa-Pro dipeptidyl-peptidase [Armatimonas rosea]MBB6052097.1 X-Pro dipeptidyl-peptidase [Armatimonas rosea]
MSTARSSSLRLGSLLSLIVPLTLLSGPAHAQNSLAKPLFADGQAQVVPAFATPTEWIREHLWVETEFDSDNDGKRDRVHVDVIRQRQTQTEGLKVPVIYESSPYFAGTSGNFDVNWDVHQELGTDPPQRTAHPNVPFNPNRTSVSGSLAATWVPRGFAVVHSEAPGTGLSQGSPTVGGLPERLAPKAVIDWLNGRAKGYTTRDGQTEIKADWCTGKVGMTGTSYNGTIPVAAATTGVKGLEAIIPVAPNTSYYHYYRTNGLVRSPGGYLGEDIDSLYDFINSGDPANRAVGDRIYRDGLFAQNQDRKTGDYSAFWAERDLLNFTQNIKCAVLMAHAFNDWNVVPEHSVRISQAIKGRVPLVQYFHQGGHGGDPPLELMNKWFSRFLYGVENGVEKGPKSYIVREREPGAPRPAPTAYADYPNPDAKPITLFLATGGNTTGALSPVKPAKQATEALLDDVELAAPALVQTPDSPNRLLYATPELTAPLHLSGTARITIKLASSAPAANLSVYLVQLPWTAGPMGTANLITRGWADPQNYKSLTKGGDYHSMTPGTPLKPGEFVTLTFDLEPDDQIIPAGKKIGLMILSSDHDFTLWPKAGTKLTVDLDATQITLPIVGGVPAFKRATSSN